MRRGRLARAGIAVALMIGASMASMPAHADGPIVIAHRGASGYLPEHTLAGYELAVRLGADMIEPDLQLTRDGELVAMHDDTLERATDVAARYTPRDGGYKVASFTLAEIRTLTVQPTGGAAATYAGFTPAFPELRVPTLQQVIDLARAQARAVGRSVGIYPEAKQADPLMEDKILETLRRNGYDRAPDEVFIQSFSEATVRSLDAKQRALGLELPLVLLGNALTAPDGSALLGVRGGARLPLAEVAAFAECVGIAIGKPEFPVTKAWIEQAHAAGLQVHGWTFAQRDPALAADEFKLYLDMGIDGVFANYPDLAAAAARERGRR